MQSVLVQVMIKWHKEIFVDIELGKSYIGLRVVIRCLQLLSQLSPPSRTAH